MKRLLLAASVLAVAGPALASEWKRLPSPPLPADTPVERGRIGFQNHCAICHGTEPDAAGTLSLQVKYAGAKPAPLEQRTDLSPEAVAYFVRHGSGMMPFFPKSEISDTTLGEIGAYLSRPGPR